MIIKEYEELILKRNNFYLLHLKVFEYFNISFLSTFLISDFGFIKDDLEKNIQYYFIDRDGIGFPLTMVVLDGAKTMVYIGIMPDPCDYDNDYPFWENRIRTFSRKLIRSFDYFQR